MRCIQAAITILILDDYSHFVPHFTRLLETTAACIQNTEWSRVVSLRGSIGRRGVCAMPKLHELVFLMDRRTGFGLVSLPMPASPLDRRSASLISLFGRGKKEGKKEGRKRGWIYKDTHRHFDPPLFRLA